MPRLWTDTIETHRRQVRSAVLNTTAELVNQHGLRSITMSKIAENAGIGRATLYKYFPDVESILVEWHEEQVTGHLELLTRASQGGQTPTQQLRSLLEAYAQMTHRWGEHSSAGTIFNMLHQGENVTKAEQSLSELLRQLIAAAVAEGTVRDDVPPDELAWFCLNAVKTAQHLPSAASVCRMIALIMMALSEASATVDHATSTQEETVRPSAESRD